MSVTDIDLTTDGFDGIDLGAEVETQELLAKFDEIAAESKDPTVVPDWRQTWEEIQREQKYWDRMKRSDPTLDRMGDKIYESAEGMHVFLEPLMPRKLSEITPEEWDTLGDSYVLSTKPLMTGEGGNAVVFKEVDSDADAFRPLICYICKDVAIDPMKCTPETYTGNNAQSAELCEANAASYHWYCSLCVDKALKAVGASTMKCVCQNTLAFHDRFRLTDKEADHYCQLYAVDRARRAIRTLGGLTHDYHNLVKSRDEWVTEYFTNSSDAFFALKREMQSLQALYHSEKQKVVDLNIELSKFGMFNVVFANNNALRHEIGRYMRLKENWDRREGQLVNSRLVRLQEFQEERDEANSKIRALESTIKNISKENAQLRAALQISNIPSATVSRAPATSPREEAILPTVPDSQLGDDWNPLPPSQATALASIAAEKQALEADLVNNGYLAVTAHLAIRHETTTNSARVYVRDRWLEIPNARTDWPLSQLWLKVIDACGQANIPVPSSQGHCLTYLYYKQFPLESGYQTVLRDIHNGYAPTFIVQPVFGPILPDHGIKLWLDVSTTAGPIPEDVRRMMERHAERTVETRSPRHRDRRHRPSYRSPGQNEPSPQRRRQDDWN